MVRIEIKGLPRIKKYLEGPKYKKLIREAIKESVRKSLSGKKESERWQLKDL